MSSSSPFIPPIEPCAAAQTVGGKLVSGVSALQNLAADPDFAGLGARISRFNLLEAVGIVRQELSHSNILAYLMDPKQHHGLRDNFARRFLTKALEQAATDSPEQALPIEIPEDLSAALVFREWRNIDILLLDEGQRLAVIIENKIDGGEHSDQLGRYHDIISLEFPNLKVLPLYLTPDAARPSDPRYMALDYPLVIKALDDTLADARLDPEPDVRTLLVHYRQLLRRHIVADTDVAELCRKLYEKHRHALDLIFEHRPDRLGEIRRLVVAMVKGTDPAVRFNWSSKTWIQFSTPTLDYSHLHVPEAMHPSGRLLLFWFGNEPKGLQLTLYIQPGPKERRQRLHEMARTHSPPLFTTGTLGKGYRAIYQRQFLNQNDVESAPLDDIEQKISTAWDNFVLHDLANLEVVVSAEIAGWSRTETC